MSETIEKAESAIRGTEYSAAELFALAKALKDDSHFGLAWQVLQLIDTGSDQKFAKLVRQQTALCVYKDPDLPSDDRLDQALEILASGCEDLTTTVDRETLGIAGGAYKRMWEDDGQRNHLERALDYYRRGHEAPLTADNDDDGYCGINAAFILDLIGTQEAEGGDNAAAKARFAAARKIRGEVLTHLQTKVSANGGNWWQYATLAEAALGLGDYEQARARLELAEPCQPKNWELESTVRQLATLVRLQAPQNGGDAWQHAAEGMLKSSLKLNDAQLTSSAIGKVGLALSGGGMRAALYHIGVFARLAEMDLLRHVDVISCVSGGSIAGAYYYLKLKQLLEAKSDDQITRSDYIQLVAEMADEFRAGVQKNIRTRVAASFFVNLRMIFTDSYSRTERAGELYEKYLYQQITESDEPILLRNLLVHPQGEPATFKPKNDNWRRANKVPILVLNATTLNTGHQWQFTSTFMGEPPRPRRGGIDSIYRLRRMYISGDTDRNEAPGDFADVRLGIAVGSSAAVPGLFEPITFKKLFPDRTVRLVDGGVHDNQGLASLFEQSCKVVLVSDASGQMKATDTPSSGIIGVLTRADGILQSRVREAQYKDLAARRRAGLLQGSMFIHLTKDLAGTDVDWTGCRNPTSITSPALLTPYGVDHRIQRQLAEVRTDLDSFSDAECYALMTSGYLMTRHDLNATNVPTLHTFAVPGQETWKFLGAKAALDASNAKDNERMRKLLEASSKLAFKIWSQNTILRWTGWALLVLLVLGGGFYTATHWKVEAFALTYGAIGTFVIGLILTKVGLSMLKWLNVKKTISDLATGVGLATLGWLAAGIHLLIFDPLFLRNGRWPAAGPQQVTTGTTTKGPKLPVAGTPPPDGGAPQQPPGGKDSERQPRRD